MRDKETIEIGLSAAETGHLVLSTLHTVDAGQTMNRILGMFPVEEENQIRTRLADVIRWVVCQRLLPKVGGGRVAAFEIMHTNLRVKDMILHGESEGKTYYDVIHDGKAFGMMTFDDSIIGCTKRASLPRRLLWPMLPAKAQWAAESTQSRPHAEKLLRILRILRWITITERRYSSEQTFWLLPMELQKRKES
jgi:hypothetical protein